MRERPGPGGERQGPGNRHDLKAMTVIGLIDESRRSDEHEHGQRGDPPMPRSDRTNEQPAFVHPRNACTTPIKLASPRLTAGFNQGEGSGDLFIVFDLDVAILI